MPTTSIWQATVQPPDYPPLDRDVEADVCVIGAGIAGLTTAWLLTRAGRRVTVLDLRGISAGESLHTTAHCTTAFDDRYVSVRRAHGIEGARIVAESQAAAIDRIERIVEKEGIACDFARVDGFLVPAAGESATVLAEELEASLEAGLQDVALIGCAPVPGFGDRPALRYRRQARMNVPRYLAGLARALEREGAVIHGGTRVTSLEDDDRPRLRCATGASVRANAVVVATNSPVLDRVAMHAKQAPYRTYVVGIRVPHGTMPDVLLWDTEDPYHYVRLVRGEETGDTEHDLVLVGGEDHKTGEANDGAARFARLERWARERLGEGGLALRDVAWRWSGQVQEPADFVGFAGRDPGNDGPVWLITGDSGQGITHGTIGAMIVRDLILGRHSPWAELYNPARKPLGSLETLREFAKEQADVAVRFVSDRIRAEPDGTEPAVGEGVVVRRGRRLVARFRDADGTIHERAASCRHLGCPVHWNATEQSWDCPCHGSRYDAYGRVIAGPATEDLGPA